MKSRKAEVIETPAVVPFEQPPVLVAKQRGGFREGSGRKPFRNPKRRKENSAYISLTDSEKASLERAAAKEGLTLSFYLRKQLGLSIEDDAARAK